MAAEEEIKGGTPIKSSRLVAAQAIVRCAKGGYSQLVLDSVLRQAQLKKQDAAFASALFYGTLERQATLDAVIATYTKHSLDTEVRAVLRCALYQLLYMPSVPDHTATDEAVRSVRALKKSSAAGLVNGVLRNFLRDGKRLPKAGDPIGQLVIDYSCSPDVAELLVEWLGRETATDCLKSALGRPSLYARVNTLKTDSDTLIAKLQAEGVLATKGILSDSLMLSGDAAHAKAFAEGLFFVQDGSAQRAALALGAKAGERVLDLCAAPGSKSFLTAIEMQNTGEIIACDLSAGRLRLVDEGAQRLGITTIQTVVNDGTIYNENMGLFDRILCDAPCSGLGVIRRKPELKYRTRAELAGFASLQRKILSCAAKYAKNGTILIYSTCTLNPEENEGVVDAFLQEHPDFAPYAFDGECTTHTNLIGEDGFDGFFIAGLIKTRD